VIQGVKNIAPTVFLFILALTLCAQVNFPLNTGRADSLQKLLPSVSGKQRVDMLNSISFDLIRHYSSRSDSLASLSVQLAIETGYKEGLANAYFCKGTNDYLNGNFITALTTLHDALSLYQEIADTNMIIETYYQIGAVSYFSFTDLKEGLNSVHSCLDYAKAAGYKHWESQLYSTMQYLYSLAGNHDSAYKYLQQYTEFAKERSVPRLEETMVIAAYGRTYFHQGNYQKALDQYLITWPRVNPDDIEERAYLSQLAHSIGEAYSKLELPDSAFYYYHLGLALARKNKHVWGSMMNSFGLAQYYLSVKNLVSAEHYCDSAINFGSQIDSLRSFYGVKEYSKLMGMSGELYIPINNEFKRFLAWRVMAGAYHILIQINEQQGNYKDAHEISKSARIVQDKIANFQKRIAILDLQYKYQLQQKDDQITLLSKENQIQLFKIGRSRLILISVVIISILLLFILVLYLRQNRNKSERKVADFKQRLLRSQMNPHFIFNSLTSIQNFIIKQDDIKASVYLSRFSELVRSILNHSLVEKITLEEELKTIENYLALQKIRFPDKFDYTIEIDPGIDLETVLVPPMLAQPFIENSIEHGIKHKEGKGRIDIRCKRSNDVTIFEIEDDGVGRERARDLLLKQEESHKSLATVITRERIAALNRRSKKKITLEIIDLKDDEGQARGTLVRFVIPV
jgi:tetratricopeptide (TPR) repeat protein